MTMAENLLSLGEIQNLGQGTRERLVTDRARAALDARGMYGAGVIQAAPGYSFAEATPCWLILACYAGAGEVLVGGEWHSCGCGSVYIVPPGTFHAYRAVGPTPWGLCWGMYYQPGELDCIGAGAPFLMKSEVRAYLMTILGLYEESVGAGDRLALAHWVELLHLQTLRLLERVPERDRLNDLWQRVENDLAQAWTLASLSDLACLGPEQLRLRTRKCYGRSPMRQVTALRMRRASVLLQTTDDTVASISERVGYTDPYAFSGAFKRWMDKTPSECRGPRDRAALLSPLQTGTIPRKSKKNQQKV